MASKADGIFPDLGNALKSAGHKMDPLPGAIPGGVARTSNKAHGEILDLDDTRVELTGNSTNRVDRTTSEPLYRSDDRPPSVIFDQGLQVRDPSKNDLEAFVSYNVPSNFVSTTRDESLYKQWGSDFRYNIDAPGGIDVDATMPKGPHGPLTSDPESEIAFQGGVPTENIVGANPVLPGGKLGTWMPNPNYSGNN